MSNTPQSQYITAVKLAQTLLDTQRTQPPGCDPSNYIRRWAFLIQNALEKASGEER